MASIDHLLAIIAQYVNSAEPLTEDTALLSTGLLDSFDIVALVAHVEDDFGTEIIVEEISVDNFDTPRQIWQWVRDSAT